MIRIAICDDMPLHLQQAEKLALKVMEAQVPVPAFQTRLFPSAEALLVSIEEEGFQPDIAILDIELGGENGISLAKKLNRLTPGCRIIFLTGFLEYAPDAYEAEHIWFVLKSRAGEHFEPAMKKALVSLKENASAEPGLLLRQNGRKLFLPLDQVIYISRVSRKAFVHTASCDYADTRRPALLIPSSLQAHFLQCHQGYWINKSWLAELDHDEFILKDGSRIPISRSFRDNARAAFFERFR